MGIAGIFGEFSEPTVGFTNEAGDVFDVSPTFLSNPNLYRVEIDVPSLVDDTFTLTGEFSIFSGTGIERLDASQLRFSSVLEQFNDFFDDAVNLSGNGDGTFSVTYDVDFLQSQFATNGEFNDIITIEDTSNQTDDRIDTLTVIFTCFAPGTGIATPGGDIAIEDLSVGDLVCTADGRTVPVRWIGRQTVSLRFGPPERLVLVRVRAGALGENQPKRDLVVTADHALVIGGLLINASVLVGGTPEIDWLPLSEMGPTYTVFHLETDAHELILAEGVETESFVDYTGRRAFDNFDDYKTLYGCVRVIPEMPLPRISTQRLLPRGLRHRFGLAKRGPREIAARSA